ncbi:MAG: hypothetical protein V1850_00155 [Candidatus Bathyarchaeota archaeon]
MQPALVGQGFDTSLIVLLIFTAFFVLITLLSRREESRFLKGDTAVFATTYDIEVAYDAIVKQVEEWRRRPFKRRWSFASLRLGVPRFSIYRDTPPRLYRVVDRYAGVMTFELAPIEGGGTSIKVTNSPGSQVLIKAFRAKMPVKVPSSIGKSCSSCKRVFPPIYTHCPYCGIALP